MPYTKISIYPKALHKHVHSKLFITKLILTILVLGLPIFCCCTKKGSTEQSSQVREITDMAGRTVLLPNKITKIFCSDETATFFIYALSPDLLVARNSPVKEKEQSFTSEHFQKLQPLGRVFCGRSELIIEQLIKIKPDVMICPIFSFTSRSYIEGFENAGKTAGIPVLLIALDFEKLSSSYEFMGKLLGREKQASLLSEYCKNTLTWANSIRKSISKPVRVYVAEGKEGLETIPSNTTHSETLKLAGVENCADIDEAFGFKEMSLDFEQILKWNPDLIIINSREGNKSENHLLTFIQKDKRWNRLNAVKNNKLLITPNAPFNWIGRPPGINRIIGIRWLINELYPDLSKYDFNKEVKNFYSLFYHIELDSTQINNIISNDSHTKK